jgi:hypothetical protein
MSSRSRDRRDQAFEDSPSAFRIYRKRCILQLLDIDQSTWWRWRQQGRVPPPAFKVGKIEGWTADQLRALFGKAPDDDAQ